LFAFFAVGGPAAYGEMASDPAASEPLSASRDRGSSSWGSPMEPDVLSKDGRVPDAFDLDAGRLQASVHPRANLAACFPRRIL